MPELPEVETIVRDLRPKVLGRTFDQVEVGATRMVRTPSPDELKRALKGRRIRALDRRGKYMVFDLDHGALVVHLMMGGALRWTPPHGEEADPEPLRHLRLRFGLDDGSELGLVNPRTLGNVWLVDSAAQVIGRLGPEPLTDEFTVAVLRQRLQRHKGPIKPVLLDQSVIAGIGNIYADESLFRSGIRPERPTDGLSDAETKKLHAGIKESLETGIRLRGTSMGDFMDPFGEKGQNQTALNVYHQQGKPCTRCGTPIERKEFHGRGTHFCPHCQQ